MKRYILIFAFLLFICGLSVNARTLHVLAIGNSFSEDAVEQDLHALASMGGYEIIIGNLYYPACNLQRHWNNLKKNKGEYSFRKINVNGKADTIPNCTMARALRDEPWDIITFQQGSALSGVFSSYRFLPNLIKRVREIVGNHPKFYWHQTWAYAPESTHKAFKTYSKDQFRMYASILYCTRKVLNENPELKGLIPTGTAIQDARTALGPDLTRDGHHLDLSVGRYIASATWYKVLFPNAHFITTYLPEGMTYNQATICHQAVIDAIAHPYEIINLEKYVEP
ncbi:MAG: DUF4886 domain-containing protein [Muribaculaceae bacterium]|nr:DUF4886 domain-containing protein [Muribaculaceae bacterium]